MEPAAASLCTPATAGHYPTAPAWLDSRPFTVSNTEPDPSPLNLEAAQNRPAVSSTLDVFRSQKTAAVSCLPQFSPKKNSYEAGKRGSQSLASCLSLAASLSLLWGVRQPHPLASAPTS